MGCVEEGYKGCLPYFFFFFFFFFTKEISEFIFSQKPITVHIKQNHTYKQHSVNSFILAVTQARHLNIQHQQPYKTWGTQIFPTVFYINVSRKNCTKQTNKKTLLYSKDTTHIHAMQVFFSGKKVTIEAFVKYRFRQIHLIRNNYFYEKHQNHRRGT
eukprot:TRINITY_DN31332_c0_g1_i1.p2 TRINITY_DN31332_c0_g1~~TRINITY_DN31332_c0_g1_i1.p2  ORF type:complete len:157 (-),score=4.77 TRINITY_DN31332_c0_g1_i1:67-537(-)